MAGFRPLSAIQMPGRPKLCYPELGLLDRQSQIVSLDAQLVMNDVLAVLDVDMETRWHRMRPSLASALHSSMNTLFAP
ncbi:hypothetical protein [Methylobacterium gnaphalii]|uniref:Uncharacterized protein n=1 Tax=Methylobacterium gnaphalii TaxID=1010610 RepID=A0A512JS30_9HYPH|nr:hypothetical protein [Methylobacterium gnaphalii]GEP12766.1 hypothetical protein MGN01_46110 [Methylobacterium gnaphalii]GJD70641.1 hypothetical protein MMMDOFMJ_3593 [Methylobacterium gnaphalii]GLS48600.1 hypothetical protein GCM10007885_14440 [Methylobacterium gnaphalii]